MLEMREPDTERRTASERPRQQPARMSSELPTPIYGRTQRLLNMWAVLTAVATVLLLVIGSIVTTLKVGMADPIWPTYPWHLLLIEWQEPRAGFLIEHSHRAMGYLVGCLTIVLAAALWRFEQRRWLRWVGTGALSAVIVMGLLGGFRVRLHERFGLDLATVHGSFSHLVFALLCSIALFTARGWVEPDITWGTAAQNRRLMRAAWMAAGLAYLQIVFGAVLRHTLSPVSQRLHVLIAFAVVAAIAWLARTVFVERVGRPQLRRLLDLLITLVAVQLMLGVETWISRFGSGVLPELQQATLRQVLLRTGHFIVGTLVFSTTVLTALMATRSALAAEPEGAR